VILPITDPYVRHHGALGSYATVFLEPAVSASEAMRLLNQQPGVELVLDRAGAARTFDLPADRIGDLVVTSDRNTVLGKSKATLDLSALGGMRLRSHGGLSERNVYLMFSRPLNERYSKIALSRPLRNFDVFEFLLNGLQSLATNRQ
jgi:phosphonoacetate hydrolase